MIRKFSWGAPGRPPTIFWGARKPPKLILGGSWRRPCGQEPPGPLNTPSGEPFWRIFQLFVHVFLMFWCVARVFVFRCFLVWFSFDLGSDFLVFEAARKKAHILIPPQKPMNFNGFSRSTLPPAPRPGSQTAQENI